MPKIRFVNNLFVIAHGKQPRGYGNWWFTCLAGETYNFSGTLSEAKKSCEKAVREAHPKADFITVYVMS